MYGHAYMLEENSRTASKAAIRRASKKARADMHKLNSELEKELKSIYARAADDIRSYLQLRAGDDNTLRLEVMRDLLDQAKSRLNAMAAERNGLMNKDLFDAADLGVQPFAQVTSNITRISDEAVRFVSSFVAEDGLQLSDRIWAIDNHAKQVVADEIQRAIIQGHSASKAAQDFLARGAGIPPELARKINASQWDRIYRGIENGIFSSDGGVYSNALRVFRTEINRAHGEAYMTAAFDHPDVVGTRFLLSPNHPRTDICDMHASVNLYGLGPGVYPKDRNPWPAHPNTLSFVEVVFADEVSEQDRQGKQDRLGWLRAQTPLTQASILGKHKAAALQADLLTERQINTPWRVLKKRYEKQGIDVEALAPKRVRPKDNQGLGVIGMDPGEFQVYVDEALAHAPLSVHKIIEKTVVPDSIHIIPSGGSFFYDKMITLAKTSMKTTSSRSKYGVYLHEYGHFIDYWAQSPDGLGRVPPLSMTPNDSGGIFDTIRWAKTSLYANSAARKAKVSSIRQELDKRRDAYLADLFGALTRNRIGWGHSKRYLSKPGFSETEIFANMFELYSRQDRSAWDFVVQELPELATEFISVLEGFLHE